jgi:hypothetical protein
MRQLDGYFGRRKGGAEDPMIGRTRAAKGLHYHQKDAEASRLLQKDFLRERNVHTKLSEQRTDQRASICAQENAKHLGVLGPKPTAEHLRNSPTHKGNMGVLMMIRDASTLVNRQQTLLKFSGDGTDELISVTVAVREVQGVGSGLTLMDFGSVVTVGVADSNGNFVDKDAVLCHEVKTRIFRASGANDRSGFFSTTIRVDGISHPTPAGSIQALLIEDRRNGVVKYWSVNYVCCGCRSKTFL